MSTNLSLIKLNREAQQFNPEMIKLAREARGYSQSELCDALHITQGTISKIENLILEPSEELMEKIGLALNFPLSFFQRNQAVYPASLWYYRRRVTIPKKTISKAEARMNIIRIAIQKLLEHIEIPDSNLIRWNVDDSGSPETAARFLRERWQIPRGRIDNLVKLVERNGIIVVHFDFESEKLDGLSLFTENGQPIIFLNKNLSGDRLRLTLAHELGHLILHLGQVVPTVRDPETEAYAFASEFLVPIEEFRMDFFHLGLKELADLKRYWKVSMASLVYKARENEMITENQAKYLFAQFAAAGYKKNEPIELSVEKEFPTIIPNVVKLYLDNLKYSIEQLSETVCLTVSDFESEFMYDPYKLKVIRR